MTDDLFRLLRLLRLRTAPICMKLYEHIEDMEAVPKIRRPNAVYTTDQVVGQAARLGTPNESLQRTASKRRFAPFAVCR